MRPDRVSLEPDKPDLARRVFEEERRLLDTRVAVQTDRVGRIRALIDDQTAAIERLPRNRREEAYRKRCRNLELSLAEAEARLALLREERDRG